MAHVLYIRYWSDASAIERARTACERGGHRLDDVRHSLEAIAALDEGPYDIVVFEASAPLGDAVALARSIRECRRLQDPHVIALLDGPTVEDQMALMAAGVDLVFDAFVSAASFERVFRRALAQPERLPGFLEAMTRAWLRVGTTEPATT